MPYNLKCMVEIATGGDDGDSDDTSMMIDDSVSEKRDAPSGSTEVIKFEFQVYRTREGEYTLDVQRLEGSLLLFLSITSDLMTSLH